MSTASVSRLVAVLAIAAGSLSLRESLPQQGTGLVRGRVETAERARPLPRPSIAEIAGGLSMKHDPAEPRSSVVYLKEAPRGAFTDLPAGRARLDQRHEQFVPHVLAITVGTTVDFPNNDLTFHNVFSLSPVKTFDLGRYPVGQSRSVRFDRAGIVSVFCDIHSHMSASILVFTHPFFAVTDDEGRFTISGIPPGAYEVAVWSEAGRADPQRVTIADGSSVEAVFRVGRRR